MSEHIVSTNQLDMELAVSRVLKKKTIHKYKKLSLKNAEHLFSHIIYVFFLIVEILLTNSVQELLISKFLMGASKNNMIFVTV